MISWNNTAYCRCEKHLKWEPAWHEHTTDNLALPFCFCMSELLGCFLTGAVLVLQSDSRSLLCGYGLGSLFVQCRLEHRRSIDGVHETSTRWHLCRTGAGNWNERLPAHRHARVLLKLRVRCYSFPLVHSSLLCYLLLFILFSDTMSC